jgi:hypothetical protein
MEASMIEKRSLVFYNELKSSWEKKLYIEACTQLVIWKSKGVRGKT